MCFQASLINLLSIKSALLNIIIFSFLSCQVISVRFLDIFLNGIEQFPVLQVLLPAQYILDMSVLYFFVDNNARKSELILVAVFRSVAVYSISTCAVLYIRKQDSLSGIMIDAKMYFFNFCLSRFHSSKRSILH